MMKKLTAMLLTALLILGFAACNGDPSGPSSEPAGESGQGDNPGAAPKGQVTIRFATSHVAYDSWLDYIEEWNQNTSHINLVLEKEANNDLRTKLTTDMAANNMPDLFNYWTKTSLKTFIDNDLLVDIDEYFALSDVNTRDQWPADAFRAFNLDDGDTAYGWPEEGSTNILIANKELFQQYSLDYPTTYEELLAVSATFTENGIIPLAIGSQHGDAGFWLYSNIFYQYADAQHLVDITTQPDLWKSSDAVRKTSDLILDMANSGVFPEDTMANGLWDPIVALYNEQKAAMMVLFPWTCKSVSEEAAARSEHIQMPVMPDAVNDPVQFTVGGTNFGLCAYKPSWNDSSKQGAMVEVLDMLLGDEAQYRMYEYGACSQKLLDSYPASKDEGISKLYYDAEASYASIPHHMWSMMPDVPSRELYMDLMDGLYARTTTTDDFISQVGDAINEDIGA